MHSSNRAGRIAGRHRGLAVVSLAAVAALGLAACSSSKSTGSTSTPPPSSGGGTSPSTSASTGGSPSASSSQLNGGKPVTLTWWHNANQDPGLSAFKKVADDFHSMHPNVSFTVQPIQNEDIKTKIAAALQGTPPSIFQQWGGGSMATQVESGKLMDMTQAASSWIGSLGAGVKGWQTSDGKQYGIPYDYHVVGFWYRTDLFQQAGITDPPKTLDDLLADVTKLKAKGIAPIAVGSKDKWPDAFYYENFVLQECPKATVTSSIAAVKFTDPCFVKAGDDLKKLLDAKPFNTGFLATPAQQGAGSSAGLLANGKAAMELQGDWEMAVLPSLTSDKNFASKMGWFPFPSISGGQGEPGAALGGGDGFSCAKDATDACPAFLGYFTSGPVESDLVKANAITIPSNKDAVSAITDPTLQKVQTYMQGVNYNQLYFDQALPTNAGNALNDAIANFFAGSGSAQAIADSVGKAASQ